MIVCVCENVTEQEIADVIDANTTIADVENKTLAGSCCGACREIIETMIENATELQRS